ncbi:MerR family transcriptional regulator [Phreatobacter stygius]|uniref:MerR family transcriptional regulator n=1 Tax=Phreatobacter stygius TaxID=1940610 RepID=A0A4D7BE61_9HYPH|nr:MerR family transcriptional regulator [Phreatobacter stygius]QCI66272.1 MerR family transcriptional regulator [Phreatobacter stygius]
MTEKLHTIGELSKLSGLSVRRIRFYSDKGLLPPATRTFSNYRIYSETDVARLDLIRTLRDAGVSLDIIRKILSRRLSLADVLTMRLQALEAEIAAQRRVAAVLRATLRAPHPSPSDLRRLWTVTTLSNAQFRTMIERFYDQVAEGARMDDDWKRQMIAAGTPELPDDPTSEQIDAWTELTAIITDQNFIAEMRTEAAGFWNDEFDPAAYAEAANRIMAKVRKAIEDGVQPSSSTGLAIARDWLESSAKAMKRVPDASFLEWHRAQYRKHHSRSTRYQELLAILRGDARNPSGAEWSWINEAMKPLLADAV